MHRYLIRRLLLVILTLFSVSIIVFGTVRLIPGDLIDRIVVENVRRSGVDGFIVDRDALEEALGLDVPIYVQYVRWVGNILLRGDLSVSLRNGEPVTKIMQSRVLVTLELGLMALVIGTLIALPVGIYSAIRQDTVADYLGRSISLIGLAIPNFWLATLIVTFPAIWWGWSPALGLVQFTEDPVGNLKQFAVPGMIMGTALAANTMRMTRTMMLEVLRQDYIRTAYSKGLKERVVISRHALKNALIPVVTIIGSNLPVLVGGAVIMENIFGLPGMGRLMLDSLQQRDYTIVSGVNLVIATAIIGANLLVDISYAYLDPRVRYS